MRLAVMLAVLVSVAGFSAHAADNSLSPAANQAFLAAYDKRPGVVIKPDGLRYADLPKPQKGFLHHVVDIRREGKPGAQIRAQQRFVDLHLLGEPASFLGGGEATWRRRVHDGASEGCGEPVAAAGRLRQG